jgi:hypothetical protein
MWKDEGDAKASLNLSVGEEELGEEARLGRRVLCGEVAGLECSDEGRVSPSKLLPRPCNQSSITASAHIGLL